MFSWAEGFSKHSFHGKKKKPENSKGLFWSEVSGELKAWASYNVPAQMSQHNVPATMSQHKLSQTKIDTTYIQREMTQKRSNQFPDVIWKASIGETSFWNLMQKPLDEISQLSLWIKKWTDVWFEGDALLRKSRAFWFVESSLEKVAYEYRRQIFAMLCQRNFGKEYVKYRVCPCLLAERKSRHPRLRKWGLLKLDKWDLPCGEKRNILFC